MRFGVPAAPTDCSTTVSWYDPSTRPVGSADSWSDLISFGMSVSVSGVMVSHAELCACRAFTPRLTLRRFCTLRLVTTRVEEPHTPESVTVAVLPASTDALPPPIALRHTPPP